MAQSSNLKTIFECNACGATHTKWQGKCNECSSWNTLHEVSKPTKFSALNHTSSVVQLSNIVQENINRFSTHIGELDRVLGNGLAEGSVVLLGGDPGIGKSTLLLQAVKKLASAIQVLYVTGEESVGQVALRAHRILDHTQTTEQNLKIMAEIELSNIISAIQSHTPMVVIIDSIQTMYTDTLSASAGSVSQVRECASALTRIAKHQKIAIIMVGHVTKDGSIAGPRVLEHIVDTVLYFEGDTHSNFRMLRSVKNRFGAINELGVFAMTDKGLQEVNNPSALFLSSYKNNIPGNCIVITQEGTRPLLIEVQALVDQSYVNPAKRLSVGIDSYRMSMLIAIISRHLHIKLFDQDIFLNIVSGIKIIESAADLAVILAIISSYKNKTLPQGLAVFGEVGLGSEVRAVQKGEQRIKEAIKLGFKRIIMPYANLPKNMPNNDEVELVPVNTISQALEYCFR